MFKKLIPKIPFVQGFQLQFLEKPEIDWHLSDFGTVLNIAGVNTIVKNILDGFLNRLVKPNLLSVPFKFTYEMAQELPVKVKGQEISYTADSTNLKGYIALILISLNLFQMKSYSKSQALKTKDLSMIYLRHILKLHNRFRWKS